MKAGIIGYGYMGQIRERVLKAHPEFNVVKIYHVEPLACPEYVDSVDAIVDDPAIDAVFVCTPNYLIKDLVVRSMANGKHVFAEKPPGICAEVEDMVAAEKKYERVLKFGFNHRYHPAVIKAKGNYSGPIHALMGGTSRNALYS